MVPNHVENQVVALRTFGEILFGVINDLICADRSDHVHISRTAHAGHFRSERLGDLHSERTHSSRRSVNQDLLPRLNLSFVAKTLQCRDCRNRYRSRLLKRQVGRFQHHCSILANRHILGEGPGSPAEYLITWLKPLYVSADRFNRTRIVDAQSSGLTEAARTLTKTSSSPGVGFSMFSNLRTSGEPYSQ